ncbi:MAG: BamA/TamA family outer membrane protein [Chlorobi bacterium]|nr:BamA/TamA family outer membrane protein [Chlorobiota bacterium]
MARSKITTYLVLLAIQAFVAVNAQTVSLAFKDKNDFSNYLGADSSAFVERSEREVTIAALPFILYNEIFGWAAGGFVGIQGLSQRNMSLYMGGLASTNGTRYGFLQIREFYLPFYPRIYIAPDILGGYFGVLKVYKDNPFAPVDPNKPKAGSNESDQNDYMEVSGYDQWYELKFRFLLPIGHGKNQVYFAPVLKNGILVSGEMGGTDWNPLVSGRTFIDIKPFYRKRVAFATNGIDFALTRENTDFYINPTRGSLQKFSFRRDFGWFDTFSSWSVIETDLRWYFPLNEYFGNKNSPPKVLAVNFWTVNTLTWNDYDVVGKDPLGNEIRMYHRPPPYTGAYLGGRYRLRAYYEGRFNDRAAIYYGAEYRQIINWNPFNYTEFTRNLNVHWLEFAFFAEIGRVAPEWKLSTLHTDMKWSVGGGIRIFMNNLILRLDDAYGSEGMYITMYVDHAF